MVVLKGCWFILLLTLCAWISCSDGFDSKDSRCWSCDGAWKACTLKVELEKLGADKTMMCNEKEGESHACYTYVPTGGGDSFSRGCLHFPKNDKDFKTEGTFNIKAGTGNFKEDGLVQMCNKKEKCNNDNWENYTTDDGKPEGSTETPAGSPSPSPPAGPGGDGSGAMFIQPGHLVVTFLATFTIWLLIKNLN